MALSLESRPLFVLLEHLKLGCIFWWHFRIVLCVNCLCFFWFFWGGVLGVQRVMVWLTIRGILGRWNNVSDWVMGTLSSHRVPGTVRIACVWGSYVSSPGYCFISRNSFINTYFPSCSGTVHIEKAGSMLESFPLFALLSYNQHYLWVGSCPPKMNIFFKYEFMGLNIFEFCSGEFFFVFWWIYFIILNWPF